MACINCSPSISREYGEVRRTSPTADCERRIRELGRQHWLGLPDLSLFLAVEALGVIERSSDIRAHSHEDVASPGSGLERGNLVLADRPRLDRDSSDIPHPRTAANSLPECGMNNGAGMAGQPLVNLRLLNRRRLDRAALVQRDEH